MRVKDWEESFATLDFVRLDLFSGRAEFLKSGAAPAYLCRDGAIVKINCESYPTGILSSCDPDVCSCKLFDGDVLVLASDGAPESALKKIPETIAAYASDCADNLAFTLGSLCMAEAAGEKQDDITLAVIKISLKKSSVCV
jgi:stage II sporulation protein E